MESFKNRHKCLFYIYFCIFMYSTGIYTYETIYIFVFLCIAQAFIPVKHQKNISTLGFTHSL